MARLHEILLVEDNPGDVELIREILADTGIPCQLNVCEDGEAALAFLENFRPDLVMLDLNLPRRDGKEVLRYIKEHPGLRYTPVVVMTSSEAERDISICYGLHANAYVIKPADLQSFTDTVRSIAQFWLTTARIPGGHYE